MDESIQPEIDDLQESLTSLEKTLLPILTAGPLSAATSTLPLLDKAKLYVLATYALESILFSYLRLNGVDAKEHEVFKELARVKEYFAKIAFAEGRGKGAAQPRLDKGAAGRFVRAGLSGNKLEDMQATGKHTRFEAAGKRFTAAEGSVPVVRASEVDEEDDLASSQPDLSGKKKKKRVISDADAANEKMERKKAKREKREQRTGKRYEHLTNEK